MLGSISYIFACCIVGIFWSYFNWGRVKRVDVDEGALMQRLDEKEAE